jgi:hypothetical protein
MHYVLGVSCTASAGAVLLAGGRGAVTSSSSLPASNPAPALDVCLNLRALSLQGLAGDCMLCVGCVDT